MLTTKKHAGLLGVALSLSIGTILNGQVHHTLLCGNEGQPRVCCLSSTADSRYYLAVTQAGIYAWNAESGQLVHQVPFQARSAVFNPRSNEFVLLSDDSSDDADRLDVYSLKKQVFRKLTIPASFTPLQFSDDGKRLLCLRDGGHVQLFSYPDGEALLDGELAKLDSVSVVTMSPDGTKLALHRDWSTKDLVQLWDVEKEEQIAGSASTVGAVRNLSFAPDCNLIAVVGEVTNKTGVGILDATRLRPIRKGFFPCNWNSRPAWFDDGSQIAIPDEDECAVFGLEQLKTIAKVQGRNTELAHVPAGNEFVLTANVEGQPLVWDWQANLRFQEPTRTLATHRDLDYWKDGREVRIDVAWSPGGDRIALGLPKQEAGGGGSHGIGRSNVNSTADAFANGVDRSVGVRPQSKEVHPGVVMIDFEQGNVQFRLSSSAFEKYSHGSFTNLRFTPDGNELGCVFDGKAFVLWDLKSQTVRVHHSAAKSPSKWLECSAFDFLPHDRRIITISYDGVQVRDLHSNRMLKYFPGIRGQSIQYVGESEFLAGLATWDIETGEELFRACRDPLDFKSALVQDELAIGGKPGSYSRVMTWDFDTHELSEPFSLHGEIATWDISVSPNGQLVATAGVDGVIRLWEIETGRLVINLRGHTNAVDAVAFSPDGKWIASASRDGTTRLWDMSDMVKDQAASFPTLARSPTAAAESSQRND